MRFGTIHTAFWDQGTQPVDVLNETVDRMVLAERLGFWSSWTTEHHFANDPDYRPFGWDQARFNAYDLVPDPITLLSFVAAKTTRLRLGTGVLVLHYHNPITLGERIAMLDVLSGGRVEIGVGRGGGFRAPRVFHVPEDANADQDKFFEELDILLGTWSGAPFSYQGKYFEVPEITVVPRPLQRPHPPLFLASLGPRALKYAAARSLSYTAVTGAWGLSGVDYHNKAHASFIEESVALGRRMSEVLYPNTLFLYCAESDAQAEEVAEAALTRYPAQAEAHYERQRNGQAALPALSALAGGPGAAATIDDVRYLVKRQLPTNLIGSPNTICEKFQALRETLPFMNYVLCITDAGSPPREFVRSSMALFAKEVMPRFVAPNVREVA